MNESPTRDARRMAELLQQQRETYLRLRELADTQRQAIETDQPEDLLRILGRRQQLITELTEINTALEPFRSRWSDLRRQLPAAERMKVGELIEEVQRLLEGILELDRGDCDELQRRTEQFRRNAVGTTRGRMMNAAYAAAAAPGGRPRFLDATDERRA